MKPPLPRPNLLEPRPEAWRPPPFRRAETRLDRLAAASRRFLDLQAASIWNDLRVVLPAVRGAVLDVGAGAQPYRGLLDPGASYRAIDSSGAETHFGYAVPDTTYYDGDRWPAADASADVVLSTETLEHVPEPAAFLAEAARCLKPGGVLVLTVPFAARWHYIPHDYWRFTPSGLGRLLTAAGFEDVGVYARGNALTVACYKLLALFLPFLMPQQGGVMAGLMSRAIGLMTLPVMVALATVGQLSLKGWGGDDCLGYTAFARKAGPGQAGGERWSP